MISRLASVSVTVAALVLGKCIAQPRRPAEPTPAEIQQRRDAGLAFLREAISVSRELAQPANRIYIEANCVQLLWETDEPLARSLVKSLEDRYRDLGRQIATAGQNERNFMQQAYNMRAPVVNAVARHDANLALEFLRNTRPPEIFSNKNQEANLEMSLAAQAAKQNVKIAADLLRNTPVTNGGPIGNALDQLYQANPEAATQAAADIVHRLATADLSDRQAFYAATQLLQMYGNPPQPDSGIVVNGGRNRPAQNAVLSPAMLRQLSQAVIAAARRPDFPPDMQQNVKTLAPILEKFSPGVTPTLEAKTAANPQADFWQKLNEVVDHGTVDQGVEFAQNAPVEMRWQAYERIANKAVADGNPTGAAEIIDRADLGPDQRRQIMERLNASAAFQAANQGKFAEARAALSTLPDFGQRVDVLCNLARNAIVREQADLAQELLEEARGLLPHMPADLQQLNQIAQIADIYLSLNFDRAAETLEPVIATVNQKLPALAQTDGFIWGQRSFAGDEMLMHSGVGPAMLSGISNALGAMAMKEPERAAALAAKLQRPEPRTLVYLEMARRLLMESSSLQQIQGFSAGTVSSFGVH